MINETKFENTIIHDNEILYSTYIDIMYPNVDYNIEVITYEIEKPSFKTKIQNFFPKVLEKSDFFSLIFNNKQTNDNH